MRFYQLHRIPLISIKVCLCDVTKCDKIHRGSSVLKTKTWLWRADSLLLSPNPWDSLSITEQRRSMCKKNKTDECFWKFRREGEEGSDVALRGQACLHNDDGEQAISEGKKGPPNSPSDACWLCLFTTVTLMREQYGGGWMDTWCDLPLK